MLATDSLGRPAPRFDQHLEDAWSLVGEVIGPRRRHGRSGPGECGRRGIEEAALPGDGAFDAFGEVGVWFPAQHPARPGRVQCARLNLTGSGLGVIRRTRDADCLPDQLVQLGDRRLYAGADVEDADRRAGLFRAFLGVGQTKQPADLENQ